MRLQRKPIPWQAMLLATALLLIPTAGVCTQSLELIWSDEFDYTGLPDSTKWDYEEGFIRNKEKQYYTRARKENARVENGTLVIEARKEDYTPPNHPPVSYTAASINTLGKFGFQYGRIEVRASIPKGHGLWPAIWMMGTNITAIGWPKCGEIDIMEYFGHIPDTVFGTVHYPLDGNTSSSGSKLKVTGLHEDFHVYALEWYPDRLDIFFDGQKYHTFRIDDAGRGPDNPFRKPHYLLINFALHSNWDAAKDDALLPQKYLVDYVRIYKMKAPSAP